jgi:hypothetical protein
MKLGVAVNTIIAHAVSGHDPFSGELRQNNLSPHYERLVRETMHALLLGYLQGALIEINKSFAAIEAIALSPDVQNLEDFISKSQQVQARLRQNLTALANPQEENLP